MIQKSLGLVDTDADGVIIFYWDDDHKGVDIQLEDIFGHTVSATFYKKDLIKTLKRLTKKLEN
mgnify:CR=1 FL=1